MKKLSLIAALLLAGCGNGNDNSRFPPPPPPPVTDAFYEAVLAMVADSPDDAEANSIDTTSATIPEDNEPLEL